MTDLLQGEKKKPFEERFFSSPPAPPHLFPNLLITFDIFFSQIYRKLLER